MNPSDLAGLVTTRSYYLTASAATQRQIRERAADLLADPFPDADHIDLPYRTHCFRTRLADTTVEAGGPPGIRMRTYVGATLHPLADAAPF